MKEFNWSSTSWAPDHLRSTSRARLEQCRKAHGSSSEMFKWDGDFIRSLNVNPRQRAENPIPQPMPEAREFDYSKFAIDYAKKLEASERRVEMALKIGGAIGFYLFLVYLLTR